MKDQPLTFYGCDTCGKSAADSHAMSHRKKSIEDALPLEDIDIEEARQRTL